MSTWSRSPYILRLIIASLSESNDKKEPEGSDSAQGADEQTIGSANGKDGVYIVEKGDTLAIISRKIYGDLDHVDTICKMNGITASIFPSSDISIATG